MLLSADIHLRSCSGHSEVGFIGRVVRVGFAFDFDVSFNGRARGAIQPDLTWLSLVVAGFTEEGPIPALVQPKILLFEPVWAVFGCLLRAHRHKLEKIS